MCESVCLFVGQVQLSHFSLLGNMKPDKQGNYAASYRVESYTGRDKNRAERHREEQIGSEGRTGENLRDKVLTVGVFESV